MTKTYAMKRKNIILLLLLLVSCDKDIVVTHEYENLMLYAGTEEALVGKNIDKTVWTSTNYWTAHIEGSTLYADLVGYTALSSPDCENSIYVDVKPNRRLDSYSMCFGYSKSDVWNSFSEVRTCSSDKTTVTVYEGSKSNPKFITTYFFEDDRCEAMGVYYVNRYYKYTDILAAVMERYYYLYSEHNSDSNLVGYFAKLSGDGMLHDDMKYSAFEDRYAWVEMVVTIGEHDTGTAVTFYNIQSDKLFKDAKARSLPDAIRCLPQVGYPSRE